MAGAFLFAVAALVGPNPGHIKTFSDWSVGCDNGRACQAVSLMDMETTENQLTMVLRRAAGRTAEAVITIANIEGAVAGETLVLSVQGGAPLASAIVPSDGPVRFVVTRALFDGLKNARYASLAAASGRPLGHASMRGLGESAAYIDATQMRNGTQTALAAPGNGSANSIPNAPGLPKVTHRLPRGDRPTPLTPAEISRLRTASGCDAELEDASGPTEIVALDKGKALAFLSCGLGAYNASSVPYIVSGSGSARRIAPAQFDFAPAFSDDMKLPLMVNAGWDAKSGQLSSYAKGRGLGDCGSSELYVWDGKRFRLIGQTAMEECRGVVDWIPLWRANVVTKR